MIIQTTLKVGPSVFSNGGTLEIGQYLVNREWMIRVADQGAPQYVATVCLPDGPAARWTGHVWLKDWSENEGVPEALQAAGHVLLTGERWAGGHAWARKALLTGDMHNLVVNTPWH